MGLSPRGSFADVEPSILFPSRLERCPILAGTETCLEYRSVTICGKRYPALVDNQASLNIMSLALAKKIGLVLHADSTAFRLTDGSICHAVGRVHTRCKLVRHVGASPITHHRFYVLQHTFSPLVLGVPFLRATGLPGLFPPGVSSQTTSAAKLAESQASHSSTYLTWCLKVLLLHNSLAYKAIAIPDNGSNVNLISVEYARAIGLDLNRTSDAGLPLTLGNGQIVFALGKIHTTIQLQHNTTLSSRVPIALFAIEGLVADLVLSRHFSKKNLLFENRQPHLQWILIEREIPGFLPNSGGLTSTPMNGRTAAKADISEEASKMNRNPGALGDPNHSFFPAKKSQASDPNPAGGQVKRQEGAASHHPAPATSESEGTEGIPAVATSSNSDGPSHNSSQGAGQSSTQPSTPPSETPHKHKYHLLSWLNPKNPSRNRDMFIRTAPPQRVKERKEHEA